jgi:hypothetical protein
MVIAAIFSVLTEPGFKTRWPTTAITKVKPADKGDRIHPFATQNCLFARERLSESNSCLFGPADHQRRLSEGRTVIVDLWANKTLHKRT